MLPINLPVLEFPNTARIPRYAPQFLVLHRGSMRVVGYAYPDPRQSLTNSFPVHLIVPLPLPLDLFGPITGIPFARVIISEDMWPVVSAHWNDLLYFSGPCVDIDSLHIPTITAQHVNVQHPGGKLAYSLTLASGKTFTAPPPPLGLKPRPRPPRWTKLAAALYLMTVYGYSSSWDLLWQLRLPANPHAYDQLFHPLIDTGLATNVASVHLNRNAGPFSSMLIFEPTDLGTRLAQAYGWKPRESDWHKLQRLHQGADQLKHSAAVLALAHHLRRRFAYVGILPKTVDSNFAPDLFYSAAMEAPSVYIEVEIPARGVDEDYRAAKWRNQNDYQGYLAICTVTPGQRHRLVSVLREHHYTVAATDLASIAQGVSDFNELNPTGPIWIDGEPILKPFSSLSAS